MTQETKTYEMFWDCEYCGEAKLLGLTHRHCPVCGAAQNPEKRYFPPEDEKVAVEDHRFVGADVECGSCKAPNGASAKFCAGCGAPLEGGAQVAAVRDPLESPAPAQQPKPPEKSRKGLVIGIVAGVVVLIVAAVLVLVLWKKQETFSVTGHAWVREVQVEDYKPRSKSAWCDAMPADARSVTRTKEVRSHRKVPDGQTCRTKRVDNRDGTYSQKQVCETKYRQEPVYDMKCRFTVDRWEYARSVKAAGNGLAPAPAWPQVTLTKAGTSIGSERQGRRLETYTVHLAGPQGEPAACDFPEITWRGFPVGSMWTGEVGVITGILDCSSLKAPGS